MARQMQGSIKRMLLTALVLGTLAAGAGVASAETGSEASDAGELAGAEPAAGEDQRGGPVGPPAGEPAPEPEPEPVVRDPRIKLRIGGLRGGRLTVGKRFKAKGTMAPYVKGERVTLLVKRGKKTIKRKTVTPKRKKGSNFSKFRVTGKQVRPGRYYVEAIHKRSDKLRYEKERSKKFKIRYPKLREGNKSKTVRLFNKLLERKGYVNDEGKRFDAATARAVLAFRKVNGMSWNSKASSKIFKKLAKGKGGYRLKHPNSGKHVEADLSRQVMVLAKGDKVKEIYHVSSGAPATPTLTGSWRFYRKEPGYNNVGMYYSVYWYRGYATHGYKSVPRYPASHGCLRNPPADSKHIYDWIDIGDRIHVYR